MSVSLADSTDPLLGTILADRYRVVRMIGKGGMGAVYEGAHLELGKRVAIKVLLDKYAEDKEAVERFHREALTASQIGHEHIIDVLDIGTAPDGRRFVVLEYLDGQSLADVVAIHGKLDIDRAVLIISQVLRGLAVAHSKGIVHRDMKPDNVFLITRGDNRDFVKILDFGISKVLAAADSKVRLTATGTVVGTPIYMAPEQAMGNPVDHRADLYAVGVMLYELLAGRPPFVAESYLALVTQHLHALPPNISVFRPDVPPAVAQAVHNCLQKEPAQRPASAAEVLRYFGINSPSLIAARAAALAYVIPGSHGAQETMASSNALPTSAVYTPSRQRAVLLNDTQAATPAAKVPLRRRRRVPWIIAGLSVMIAAAVTGWALKSRSHAVANNEPSKPLVATATLEVSSEPQGASILIDGEARGNAPVVIEGLAPGNHIITAQLAGHSEATMMRPLTAGGKLAVVLTLSKLAPAQDSAIDAGIELPVEVIEPGEKPGRDRKRHGSGSGAGSGNGSGGSGVGSGSGSPGGDEPGGKSEEPKTDGLKPNPFD